MNTLYRNIVITRRSRTLLRYANPGASLRQLAHRPGKPEPGQPRHDPAFLQHREPGSVHDGRGDGPRPAGGAPSTAAIASGKRLEPPPERENGLRPSTTRARRARRQGPSDRANARAEQEDGYVGRPVADPGAARRPGHRHHRRRVLRVLELRDARARTAAARAGTRGDEVDDVVVVNPSFPRRFPGNGGPLPRRDCGRRLRSAAGEQPSTQSEACSTSSARSS